MAENAKRIYITEYDLRRLTGVLAGFKNRKKNEPAEMNRINLFEMELGRAVVVPQAQIPNDVITMNTQFRMKNVKTGEDKLYTLVFPGDADYERNRISILSLLGMSIIGRAKGETVAYSAPAGTQEFEILEVVYQPEAEANFIL